MLHHRSAGGCKILRRAAIYERKTRGDTHGRCAHLGQRNTHSFFEPGRQTADAFAGLVPDTRAGSLGGALCRKRLALSPPARPGCCVAVPAAGHPSPLPLRASCAVHSRPGIFQQTPDDVFRSDFLAVRTIAGSICTH